MSIIKNITVIYFSPTGGTHRIARLIADTVSEVLQLPIEEIDFTPLNNREKEYYFQPDDLVIMATPTYAGRIPNKIMPDWKNCMHGDHTKLIAVSVFGNRSTDECLREQLVLMEEKGFLPVGAAACVCQHVFSEKVGTNRPDEQDLEQIREYGRAVAQKISSGVSETEICLEYDRNTPIGPYYTPLQEDGTPAKFLKAKPITDLERCDHCGKCTEVCPMDSVSREDPAVVTGVCIKCMACVKICPRSAKCFEDEQMLSHTRMLEQNYARRAENQFLL